MCCIDNKMQIFDFLLSRQNTKVSWLGRESEALPRCTAAQDCNASYRELTVSLEHSNLLSKLEIQNIWLWAHYPDFIAH